MRMRLAYSRYKSVNQEQLTRVNKGIIPIHLIPDGFLER